jgi:hypothetical protein
MAGLIVQSLSSPEPQLLSNAVALFIVGAVRLPQARHDRPHPQISVPEKRCRASKHG